MQKKNMLKYLKYGIMALVVLVSIPLVLFIVFNVLFDLERWNYEKMILNDYKEPLAVGELWEEEPFSFVLERVRLANDVEWQEKRMLSESQYKEYDLSKAFVLEFSFTPKGEDGDLDSTFSLWASARDAEGNVVKPHPLPSNLEEDFTVRNNACILWTTADAYEIYITVNVPYGEKKYRKIYEFCVDDIS